MLKYRLLPYVLAAEPGEDASPSGQVATHISFSVQPANVQEDTAMSPPVVVSVLDASENPVIGDTSLITLTIHTGSGVLSNNTQVCVNGVANFTGLELDTVQSGVVLRATRSGLATVDSSSFNVTAAPSDSLQIATEFYRPLPQPHESWTPSYTTSFSYKMAPGEIMPIWFRARVGTTATLALGGANAALFEAEFFKPYGQVVDNSNQYKRATLSASPTGTYYDPLNPIPTGASNFTPEVADTYEYVVCALKAKSSTTTGDYTITFTLSTGTITGSIHVWNNITIPGSATRPLIAEAASQYSATGTTHSSSYTGAEEGSAAQSTVDLLRKYRVTPFKNCVSFLAISGSTFNIDQNSAIGGSFRQLTINSLHANDPKFWMLFPQVLTANRSLATAQAAEATIVAEGLTNMYLYVWDEPATNNATVAGNIKTILDNWSTGSPSTKLFLTARSDYDQSAGSVSAGLVFSNYPNLVLCPTINLIGGSFPAISTYTNGKTGFYSSCQGNCGSELNSNSTGGTDQSMADFAYIDYPMVRRYAAHLLSVNSSYRTKTALMMHYSALQSWINTNSSYATSAGNNPWLSARRFQVMGDGTLVYPAIRGFKPHTGLAAFGASSVATVPSLRILYNAHASFMVDLFELYRVATGSNQADSLVTSPSSFTTSYASYESLRTSIGDALEAGGSAPPPTATKLGFNVQPSAVGVNTSISPAVKVEIQDASGARVTGSTANVTIAKLTGSGTLTGTLTVAAVAGLATFSDLKLDAADTYTLRATSSGLTQADSSSFVVSAAPIDLNTITTLLHWWRGDTITLSGADISQWTDKKTSGTVHLTSTTNQNKPLKVAAGLNGYDTGRFDKSNSEASNKYLGAVATAAYFFIVFKVTDTSSDGGIMGSWDVFGDWSVKYISGGKLLNLNVGNNGGGTYAAGSTNVDTNWHWAIVKIANGGTHKVWLDGNSTPEISNSNGAQQVESVRIGALLSNTTNGDGSVASLLYGNVEVADCAVFSNAFNETTDFASLDAYVAARYGL